jgi:dGTPase
VADPVSPRTAAWAETMSGHGTGALVRAHAGSHARPGPGPVVGRELRELWEDEHLRPGATRAVGAGNRAEPEAPDDERTCFERDRDRIVHSTAFRRLAGKTQVVVYPTDHQRTRLTHALEVAQVATSIARAVGVNVALAEAIALGHDCGHGPGGHASEDAFDAFLPGGYDHGPWGADVVLTEHNLCVETLDGIRNHSWSRPAPATVEGEIVSWADRIAYCAHDLEDAMHTGIVTRQDLPAAVVEVCGASRREQLSTFVRAVVRTVDRHGEVGMPPAEAAALAGLRAFNYERIYVRPDSVAQSQAVIDVLRALVEHYLARPDQLPAGDDLDRGSEVAVRAAVTYVAGMTDRYAFDRALELLDWDPARLPPTATSA